MIREFRDFVPKYQMKIFVVIHIGDRNGKK